MLLGGCRGVLQGRGGGKRMIDNRPCVRPIKERIGLRAIVLAIVAQGGAVPVPVSC